MKNVVATLQFIVSDTKSKNIEECYASYDRPMQFHKNVWLSGYDNVGWVKRF